MIKRNRKWDENKQKMNNEWKAKQNLDEKGEKKTKVDDGQIYETILDDEWRGHEIGW